MWFVLSGLNLLFAYLAERNYDVSKLKCKIFLLLLVVVDVIILGLRDKGVGTDTLVYVDDYFQYAKSMHGLKDYFIDESFITHDRGYLLLAWLSCLIGNDSSILMFITEVFVISFIVMGCYEYKKVFNYSISWFMLFFILLFQFDSCNLMRQFCAIALLFYGYSLLLQQKIIVYIVLQIVAYFFHSTSILFIMIPIGLYFSQSNIKLRIIYVVSIIIIGIFFILNYSIFLNVIGETGLMKESYFEHYGENNRFSGVDRISFLSFASFFVSILMCYFAKKNDYLQKEHLYMLFLLVCLNFVLQMSSLIVSYFFRLAYYIGIIMVIYYAILLKKNKFVTNIFMAAYILIISFLWLRIYNTGYDRSQHNNYHLIYKSTILDIQEDYH